MIDIMLPCQPYDNQNLWEWSYSKKLSVHLLKQVVYKWDGEEVEWKRENQASWQHRYCNNYYVQLDQDSLMDFKNAYHAKKHNKN